MPPTSGQTTRTPPHLLPLRRLFLAISMLWLPLLYTHATHATAAAASTTAAPSTSRRLGVARRDAATLPAIEALGELAHAPLVITGAIEAWPALAKWSPAYFHSTFRT